MTNIEAINKRISRRTYLKTPVDTAKQNALQKLIDTLNQRSGLNFSIQNNVNEGFEGGKSYGLFKGVSSVFVLKGREMPMLREKVGYYGEILILEATRLGLGTCWVAGTYNKSSFKDIPEDEKIICVIPFGNVSNRKTLKEAFIRGIIHRKTKTIEQLSNCNVSSPDWFINAMKAVQRAPTAMNLQNVYFEYENGKVTAGSPPNKGSDPVDIGICKLHFEYGAGGKYFFNERKNIILIGMMGSGKTDIGKKAAGETGFDFCDIDEEIEKKEQKTISAIFEQDSEEAFRKIEHETTERIIKEIQKNAVISTGGGIVLNAAAMSALCGAGIVFFLNRPINDIMQDIDISNRPVLKGDKQNIKEIFDERLQFYKKYCDFEIKNDKDIDTAAKEIAKKRRELNEPFSY